MMGIGAPLSGGLIDKFGAGRIVVFCVLAALAGLYFMYAATSPTDLLISGVLMGIAVSGTGVTSLVGTIGRLAPPDKRLSAIASIGISHPTYWLLTAGFSVCGFHVAFIMVHLPAFSVDQGLPAWVGPVALYVVGIANIVGTYIAGQSGRFIEKRQGLSPIYLRRAFLFLGFLFLPITPVNVIVLCGLLGLLWLATIPLTSSLVATFFGTTWMSMLFGFDQLRAFLGVWLGGPLFDLTKSYDAMWWISIGLGVLAGLMNWLIKERPVARPITAAPHTMIAGAIRQSPSFGGIL